MTAVGSKRIEEIQKGDIVLSYDDNVGRYEETPVTDVFVNETDELTEITVGDETIVCTPGHMFMTADGWKSACDLSEGDVLKTLGRDEKVVGVRRIKLESTAMVYNLSVIGCHTYVVGKAGVIVHNSCGPVSNDEIGQGYKMANRSTLTNTNQPKNILEQYAMEHAKGYPKQGKVLPIKMNDPRWLGNQGWQKMQQTFPATINDKNAHISIHYVMNDVLKLVDDFKVK